MSDYASRMAHAARELERYARMQVLEADTDERVKDTRTLLRLTKGVRRKLDRELSLLARVPAHKKQPRRAATTRTAVTAAPSVVQR